MKRKVSPVTDGKNSNHGCTRINTDEKTGIGIRL